MTPRRPRRFRVVDGSKPPKISEDKIQISLMDYLAIALKPELEVRAIPNGGYRHIRVAQQLKASGVRRGSPDLFICLPEGRIAWLELKAAKGVLSPDQKAFRDKVTALGHLWGVAKSVDDALELLTAWDALKPAYRKQNTLFTTKHLENIKLSKGASNGTQDQNYLGRREDVTGQGR